MPFVVKVNHPESDTYNAQLGEPFDTSEEAHKAMEKYEEQDDGFGSYWVEELGNPPLHPRGCGCTICRQEPMV